MSCPKLARCALFPVLAAEPSLRVLGVQYCRDAHRACARFRADAAGMRFAPNLLPNGRQLLARDLVGIAPEHRGRLVAADPSPAGP